ncbi:hypothetical protein FQN57_001645 [Myotisia sp. PD_48]|nr:hypothetical protein FQN57_001645 [Myotisia sp. PD_48]
MAGEGKPVSASNIPKTTFVVTLWFFFALTTVLLICRLSIRLSLHRQVFWDDVFAITAYFMLLGQLVLVTVMTPQIYLLIDVYAGVTPPADYLDQITFMIKIMYAHSMLFTTCVYCVKASFLSLFWRLIRNLVNFRKAWWGTAIFCGLTYCTTIAFFPISCTKLYVYGCTDAHSIKLGLISLRFGTSVDIATDIAIMLLPIAFVMKSHLPLPQKLGLIGLFGLGGVIIAIAVLRIVATDNQSKHPPTSWLIFWGTMESCVAVITSCFAAFKSLFTLRKRSSHYRRGQYRYQLSDMRGGTGKKSVVDMDSPLTNRMAGLDKERDGRLKNDATIIISSDQDGSKWRDDDSREEILQQTEFEVRYEQMPTRPLPTKQIT